MIIYITRDGNNYQIPGHIYEQTKYLIIKFEKFRF